MRNIVFDVGGVLVQLRYQPFVDYLTTAGADMCDLREWAERVGLAQHESGFVTGHEFLERIAASVRVPLVRDELHARWLDMFEPADDMFALARDLMQDHRVYLLSNVGDLHWAHLDATYGIAGLVHGAIPSFKVGAVKPQPSIYQAAEAEFDLDPEHTVFIDDLAPNVAGAIGCGWSAIQHRSCAETRAALVALGVRLRGPAGGERR